MSEPVREILTWELFGKAARELAQQVVDSGFEPDLILSITRGGMLPAGTMSYAMGIKNLHIINVEFYTGVDERLPLPVLLPPVPVAVDLSGQTVLIIDDVADTGETLRMSRWKHLSFEFFVGIELSATGGRSYAAHAGLFLSRES